MNTITIPKKEYEELYQIKQKLEDILRAAIIKRNEITGGDILRLVKLKIKGGPKDLSSRMDSYLYKF